MSHEALENSDDRRFPSRQPEREPAPGGRPSIPAGHNPGGFLAPQAEREAHAQAESAVKIFGSLYFAYAILIFGIMALTLWMKATGELDSPQALISFLAIYGVIHLGTGVGLRRFKPWARLVGIFLAVLMLPSVPIGTILGLGILISLLSSKVRRVFQRDYQQVMAVTNPVAVRFNPLLAVTLVVMLSMLAYTLLAIALGVAG
jgi:pheromone shutdown protein TraB